MAALHDTGVSFSPYFKIPPNRMDEFRGLVDEFVAATANEPGCLYYGFCFNDHQALCREAYADGDAFLAHLDNVGELFARAQQIATVTRMEMHGPEPELAKLREPLSELDIVWFVQDCGFRR